MAVTVADSLWLAAHDNVKDKPRIGEWPLGIGLGAGLLAELIGDGHLELRDGEFFRTMQPPTTDMALGPLLATIVEEEQSQAPPQPAATRPWQEPSRQRPGPAADTPGWPYPSTADRNLHPLRASYPPMPQSAAPAFGLPPDPQTRHRQPGHRLADWLAYLAYDRRAEQLVAARLARHGLVTQVEKRRLIGAPTIRHTPYNSVVAGTPASAITIAVQRREPLDADQLLLAGLFLATGLHHHALATLTLEQRSTLEAQLAESLPAVFRELLRAADIAVGEAALRKR
ncbi:GOLPH3/VPS74 family protein [Paractinoplanes globisporus]|uniref:GPP34 family phosphoprotein n=1 Tax=Paractinoplanes globisporus TaxID=113565 RepID=A0ABW6WF04_9ACTN|nr:GPP34 family phosphoprotein [Actinoplanes globisporus]